MSRVWAAGGLLGLGAAVCAGICAGSRGWPRVWQESMTTPKLTKGRRLHILHLSDLHADSSLRMNVDVWKKLEKLSFDMAVFTGDMIVRDIRELAPHREGIRALAERVPVFFAEGNHDALFEKQIRRWLERAGVTALYNETARVTVNGARVSVVGLRDYQVLENQDFAPLTGAFASACKEDFVLALAHQPQLFEHMLNFGPDLTLSGHTHGGQVRLPFSPALYAPGQGFLPKYGDGWYAVGGSRLYVSRGIGATHFPVRFWNRPQITVITVRGE